MKQKLLIILLLFSVFSYAQEKKVYELRPYINLHQCSNCISENPIITFDKVDNISQKCEFLYSKLNNTIIPVQITMNNEGILQSISLFKEVSPIDQRIINNTFVTDFLNSLNGYKIANLNLNKDELVTGKISIKLDINKLTIINQ